MNRHTKKALGWLLGLSVAATGVLASTDLASAHIGIVNTQLPYAVAGKSYELVLAVPHGCPYSEGGVTKDADTYKVEVTIPPGFTGARPIVDGVFGKPALVTDGTNVTSITFSKNPSFDSVADDQAYRIGIRSTTPNTPFVTARFNVKQYCKNPLGGSDLVTDWANYGTPASNQSPAVKIFPARTPGWNKFSVAANNEKHTNAEVVALLKDFFSDAQIVWLLPGTNNGRGAWTANPEILLKIQQLAAQEAGSYEISANQNVMIHANDVIWAKF